MKKQQTLATLPNIAAFCLTFESGSFTKAAEQLSQTPQAVSRAVARLEDSLGVTLFRRTTRQLHPTDQGRSYYEACKQAMNTLSTAEASLQTRQKSPGGKVRISVPTTYASKLLPRMGEFRRKFPMIEVEINLSNQNIDFVREGYDLAIRLGQIEDQTLIAKRLGEFSLGLFASPSYLKEHKAPTCREQLAQHSCIVFLLPSTHRPLPWEFTAAPRQYTPSNAYEVSGDPLGQISLACAGVGIFQIYHFLVERELAAKRLIEILPNTSGATRRFSLLYPRGVVQSRAVKALVEFIVSG